MSDALLTRIAEGIDALRADIKKLGGASAGATAPKAAAATGGAATGGAVPGKTAAQKAAEKAAAEKAAAPKPAAAGPAAGTKAPGGKRTIEQVRELIRKVAADKNLGKESAKDILRDDGGGVDKVLDLKPEKYDAVYEACEVLLKGEGGSAAPAEEDDLM